MPKEESLLRQCDTEEEGGKGISLPIVAHCDGSLTHLPAHSCQDCLLRSGASKSVLKKEAKNAYLGSFL